MHRYSRCCCCRRCTAAMVGVSTVNVVISLAIRKCVPECSMSFNVYHSETSPPLQRRNTQKQEEFLLCTKSSPFCTYFRLEPCLLLSMPLLLLSHQVLVLLIAVRNLKSHPSSTGYCSILPATWMRPPTKRIVATLTRTSFDCPRVVCCCS